MTSRKKFPASPRLKPNPDFFKTSSGTKGAVSDVLLRQARKSGSLNLSNRGLGEVPDSVWKINTEAGSGAGASFASEGDERWWDQTELTRLNLSSNELKVLSEDIELLPKLQLLDVQYNRLSSLPCAIGRLQDLTRLLLGHNELAEIPSEVCELKGCLKVLRLDSNKLTRLPDRIGCLALLEELGLSDNRIESLPDSIGSLSHLSSLHLPANKLSSLPESLKNLSALRELMLSGNKLTKLPSMEGMVNLLELDLRQNLLVELPLFSTGNQLKTLLLGANRINSIVEERLTLLTVLSQLELRDNSISSVPERIVELTSLQRLDLTNNSISGLPFMMGTMENLQSVLLDGNPLRGIRRDIVTKGTTELLKYLRSRIETKEINPKLQSPDSTAKFKPPVRSSSSDSPITFTGRELDLTKHGLIAIPEEVPAMTTLTTLNVGYNKISSVPGEIGQLTKLMVLVLRNNLLADLPSELSQCVVLQDIILSFNRFQCVPAVLYSMPSLENVIADDNQIGAIDVDGLLRLPKLACLDLRNNSIAHVPPQLGNVTCLRHLELGGNSFRIPRAAILAKGTASLLEYLRDRIPT